MSENIPYIPPNVLVLHGVFIRDLSEDDNMFDTKFTQGIDDIPVLSSFTNKYDEIPKRFTTWDEWIKKTNLACWNCVLGFDTIPIPVVGSIFYDNDGKREIVPEGIFCMENCAQRYIDLHYTGSEHDNKTKHLLMLKRERLGGPLEIIKPAYSPVKMKHFKGSEAGITIEEYVALNATLNSDYNLANYKLEHYRS